jgi:hypothetical protein
MRGHTDLIAMRLRGKRPASVHIDADGLLPRRITSGWSVPRHLGADLHAELVIDPAEELHLLDLRCVVGLVVQVNGLDTPRAEAVGDACVAAGASRVIVATPELTHDTAGELTWPR